MAFRTDRRKGDLLYLFDMDRGDRGAAHEEGRVPLAQDEVGHGAERRARSRFASQPVGGLERNLSSAGDVSYVCPLFT